MKKILKFGMPLKDNVSISMPKQAQVLSVQVQAGIVQLWAMCDESTYKPRKFKVFGTGNPINENTTMLKFIGTVQLDAFVWHIFEDLTS